MSEIPVELQRNPHFIRYFNTWQKNPASIVFIPLAELYREKGHYEEAIAVCQKGLQAHPQSIGGLMTLARIHFDGENYPEARRLVGQLLTQMPGHREAMGLLSRIDAAVGGGTLPAEPASEQGSEGRGHPPAEVPLFETCTMAQIYAGQGENRTALQIVKNILARDPTNQRASELERQWSVS